MDATIIGLHHVTLVASDLDRGAEWFERVLGATHIPRFDHHDSTGMRYGVILELPGFPGMLELRVATPEYAQPPTGYDPVTFQVDDETAIDAWIARLDALGVAHSGKKLRRTGHSLEFSTPDGTLLRLFTAPAGGFSEVAFQEEHIDH